MPVKWLSDALNIFGAWQPEPQNFSRMSTHSSGEKLQGQIKSQKHIYFPMLNGNFFYVR